MREQQAFPSTVPRRATAEYPRTPHPPARRPAPPPVRRYTDTQDDDAYDDEPRSHSSTRRYVQVHHQQALVPAPRTPPPPRLHWLVYVGFAILVMLLGWLVVTLVGHLWTNAHDTMTYGYPRTAQYDEVVRHNDSPAHPSHFIALNLHGNVEVIEQAGGDPSHVHIYPIPISFHDTDPVTITFEDINRDGDVDMVVHVESTDFPFLNDNGAFRQVKAGEQVNV